MKNLNKNRSWSGKDSGKEQTINCNNEGIDDLMTPDTKKQRTGMYEIAKHSAGKYWDTTEVLRLFSFPGTHPSDIKLLHVIDYMTEYIDKPTHLKKLIHIHQQHIPTTMNQVFLLNKFCVTLRCCYIPALREMETINNWEKIVSMSIDMLKNIGIQDYTNERSIMKFHRQFRDSLTLPHPKKFVQNAKKLTPMIFHTFPEFKQRISNWCSQNLSTLSCESLRAYILDEILPSIKTFHQQDHPNISHQTQTEFNSSLGITKLSTVTVSRWLHYMAFHYKVRKKFYFSDKHEDPCNVDARKKIIQTYLHMEIRFHHWVQIPEMVAVNLETTLKLPKAFHSFTRHGELLREYHVDTDPSLFEYIRNKKMGGDMSVRKNRHEKPIIIIGQDESILRHYAFTKKSWYSPTGAVKLVPK